MRGKMKTLNGIYKKHGREKFLLAAQDYSEHVKPTIEDTLSEMESRWYDVSKKITEAEKMISDYNNGLTILNNQSHSYSDIKEMSM